MQRRIFGVRPDYLQDSGCRASVLVVMRSAKRTVLPFYQHCGHDDQRQSDVTRRIGKKKKKLTRFALKFQIFFLFIRKILILLFKLILNPLLSLK